MTTIDIKDAKSTSTEQPTSTDAQQTSTQTPVITDGFHYLVDALQANGVKTMYGVVGIPITDVARIAQAKGIRYIGMRHEQDAGNAAAAEGFLTNEPGVFLTVSAPGFLNGLAPLREATENGFPVIHLGGSSDRPTVDLQEGQYEGLDQRATAEPFCKKAIRIDKIEDIPLGIERAFRIATSGRPGGVYVDIPDSLLSQTMDAAAAQQAMFTATNLHPAIYADPRAIDEAIKLLASAKQPWIILGKGAAQAHADEAITKFIHDTKIPYQPMSMAKGLLPDDDTLSTASCRGTAMRNADVVLLIGARLNWMLSFGTNGKWNKNVKFIQIDIDPTEIGNSRNIDVPLIGDIASIMKQLNDKASDIHTPQDWLDMLSEATAKNDAKFGAKETANTIPMNHSNALGAVKKVMDKPENHDVYIINEGANTLDDCRDIVNIYLPRHRLDTGTWGVMGIGTGYAIGTSVTMEKPVVSIHGDSAFGFDGMEIETACRYGLPIVFMVFNNGGIYRGDFKNMGTDGDPSPLTLDISARYDKMIEAFGGVGYYAETPADVEKMLTEALASGKTCLIDIQLSPHAGVESGHISNLNPQPKVGVFVGNEQEDVDGDGYSDVA